MAKSTLFRSLFLFTLSITCSLLNACSEDEGERIEMEEEMEEMFDIQDFLASAISVRDITNDGNPGDLTIRFTGASAAAAISEYRVFYVQATDVADVDATSAAVLPPERFLSVPNTGDSYEETLSPNQLDFGGEQIMAETDYRMFVLSIGTFEQEEVLALAEPSELFQLVDNMEVETLVSSFPANDGLFVTPDGRVLASDFGTPDNATGIGDGTEVYSLNLDGEVEVFASGLSSPMGGVMDAEGNYYLSSDHNLSDGIIKKITPDGTVDDFATLDGWPTGLTIDAVGNLYAANFLTSTISKISSDGTVSVFANDARLAGCVGIDTDANGNIVTANFATGDVFTIDSNGTVNLIVRIDGIRQGFGVGYMTIFQGAIYATGIGDHRIYKVTFDGTSEVFAGNGSLTTVDGELSSASFAAPNGIAGDEANKILYISQFGEPGLRKIQFK